MKGNAPLCGRQIAGIAESEDNCPEECNNSLMEGVLKKATGILGKSFLVLLANIFICGFYLP